MTDTQTYDVAVLGGGPGGGGAAAQAGVRGAKVCLIEMGDLGGVCLNVGCMPSKAMLAASDICWRMQHTEVFGISLPNPRLPAGAIGGRDAQSNPRIAEGEIAPRGSGGLDRESGGSGGANPPLPAGAISTTREQDTNSPPRKRGVEPVVDGPAFMKRVADMVRTLRRRDEKGWASRRLVTILRGRGRLTGADRLVVETAGGPVEVRAKSIVIATGARPSRPPFVPWGDPRVMTSDDAVTRDDLPKSVLIVGGGVLGCEFATVYAELGIRTVLVEMADRLLPAMDPEGGQVVAESLAARGVDMHVGRKVAEMTAGPDGLSVTLDDGTRLAAATALIAAGRRANIEDIGLDAAGVEVKGGIIPVDDRCRTNVPNVYAVGDVAERRQFAHLAERMGIVAGENATGGDLADDRSVLPVGVYTHPEVATIGLSEAEAKARHGRVRILRHRYANNSMALATNERAGGLKILADDESGTIYGALWSGPHAIDMIEEIALAMKHGLGLTELFHTIHQHPSFQEAVAAAVEGWMTGRMRKGGA